MFFQKLLRINRGVVNRVFQSDEIPDIHVQDWQEREKVIWSERKKIKDFLGYKKNKDLNIHLANKLYKYLFGRVFNHIQYEDCNIYSTEEIKYKINNNLDFGRYDFPILFWSRLFDWGFPENSICIIKTNKYAFVGFHDKDDIFWVFDFFNDSSIKIKDKESIKINNQIIIPEIGFNLYSWWKYQYLK